MIAESGSSANPHSIVAGAPPGLTAPSGSHSPSETATWRDSSGRPDSSHTAPHDRRKARSTVPQAMAPTPRLPILFPSVPFTATPRSGRIGMSQISFAISPSPLEEVDLVHVGRAAQTEERDDDREPRGGLRRGEGHDEENVDLGVGAPMQAREGDEHQVRRVQHELDAHEDRDRPAAQQHADRPQREQDARQHEDEARVDHVSFRFARRTAPTIATMSSSEITSNG